MRKLVIFADGAQAVLENMTIERGSPVSEEIDLDRLSKEEQETIIDNRRKMTFVRDKQGKATEVKIGKRSIELKP